MIKDSHTPVATDYYLKPGFIYLPSKPTAISTVLGSSVAVCLYDNSLKMGGMNHFLFPWVQAKEKATACYGNMAILALIRMMKANGSRIRKLKAQIFGGSFNSGHSKKDVGKDNVSAARQILGKYRIRIVSQDVGGELGRKVVFNTATSEIVTLKVHRLRASDWYPYPSDR